MEFIPIEYQERYKQLLDYINAYKNGATSDSMKAYGVDYEKNYGVAMPDLRKIADRYRNDHDLANILWNKGWRETYILSTLLDEPEKYSLEILITRVESSPNYEVLEQLAYNIAWKVEVLDEYFPKVENWDSKLQQYFIIKSTTYQLMNKVISPMKAWVRISKYPTSDNVAILSILQNLMLRITSEAPELQQEVVNYCNAHDTATWKNLGDVIQEYGVIK